MRRRLLPFALLALLVVLAAGCGSGGSDLSTGGSPPAGAEMVRAGVVAFVSFDTDTGSAQWQQLDDLSQKFPGRDKAIAKLKQSLADESVDWKRDVEPALGPETDLAVLSAGTASSTKVVGLTKPDDAGKFKALVTKLNASDDSGSDVVYREVDGWYAFSDSEAAITDALKGDRSALADDDSFKEALGKLPDETLVRAFVDGQRLKAILSQTAAAGGTGALGLDKLKYVAASASAEDDGIRVRGAASGAPGGGDLTAKLMDGVPADALALLDFPGSGTTDGLEGLRSNPAIGAVVQQLERTLGVTLDQVLGLLRGENAFYVRPAAAIPEFTLVLEERDQDAALATLDKLMSRLAALSGGRFEKGASERVATFGGFAVRYAAKDDDKVVLTSAVNGIAEYGGSGEHLPDSADFKDARDAAGMPDSTGGFMYVDLKDALPLLEGLASLSGEDVPVEVTENLRPLRSFLAWSGGDSESRTFDAFLQIK